MLSVIHFIPRYMIIGLQGHDMTQGGMCFVAFCDKD